jgi:glycosyltransferase involved in cell wall biosynthesis
MPFFTVLIPAHDAGSTIASAIRSALAQDFEDLEIVIVNDGSTDDTAVVVQGFTDERIVLIEQAASGSPAGARNAGLRVARGEFVALLDADPSLDAVAHDVRLVGPSGGLGLRAYRLDSRSLYEQLLYRGNFLTTSAMTVRTARLRQAGGFTEAADRPVAEDFDMWLRLAEMGVRISIIPRVLGSYTVAGGISDDHVLALRNTFEVLDAHYERLASERRLRVAGALVRRSRAVGALALDQMRHGQRSLGVRTAAGIAADLFRRWMRYRRLG